MLEVGLRAGPYSLTETLGSTGLSVCYRGAHSTTAQQAAVKIFRAYFGQDETATARFLADAARVQALPPHPGILAPLEWGWTEGGQLWAAYEYAGEPSLAVSRPVDLPSVAAIVTGVAAALEHALSAGLTHRDLKPSNVFWDGTRARVSDFGTATLAEQAHALMRTSLNTPMPAFMAPEYAAEGTADASSETFSLAILAYWLLTGEHPYPAATREALHARAMAGVLRLPSTLNPAVPPAVDKVVQRALAPFPPVRPAGPVAFAAAFAEAVAANRPPGGAPAPLETQPATGRGHLGGTGFQPVLQDEILRCGSPARLLGPPQDDILARIWRPARPRTLRERLVQATLVAGFLAASVLGYAAWTRPPVPLPPSTALSATVAPTGWTLPRYDLGNSAHVPVSTGTRIRGQVRWRFQASAPFGAAAAAHDGTVYAATGDNRVVALDQDSGNLRWTAQTTGPVDAAPVIAGDLIYVGLRDSRILALDRMTGAQRWEFRTGNPIVSGGVVDRGVLYQGSGDGRLYALDAATGGPLWQFQTDSWVVTPPALTHDAVIVISRDGWIHFLERATGAERFIYNSSGSVHSAPALVDGAVHYAGGNRRLFAIDVEERSTFMDRQVYWLQVWSYLWQIGPYPGPPKGHLWSVRLPGRDYSSVAVAHGRVYLGAGTRLVAVEQGTAQTKWEVQVRAGVSGSPIVTQDTVYAGADDGKVYAVDAASGEQRWSFQTGGKVRTSPVLAGDLLLITSEDGSLYALE